MIIYIHGRAPNCVITLEAETQAERDQIQRLKKEATSSRARVVGLSHDPDTSLRLTVEGNGDAAPKS